MALQDARKALPVHEMDVNILFEKFTVEEIRDTEKKTRAEIERKKEDLRTMVGERYRDLIEAADTITDMKNSAQNVMKSIGKMEEMCKELKQNHMVKGSTYRQRSEVEQSEKRRQELKFYGVASQIKLLLDMPEKIWSALDDKDYLTATRHYLLSRHIHTSLHLDSQQSPQLLSMFPVLTRQWAAISHFRSTILQGCRGMLMEPTASDQSIADGLCSIILLEDSTPRQVFNEFLLSRTAAVQQLFHPSQHSVGVKEQICTVVQLITTTVHQIHSVFFSGESSPDCKVPSNLLLSKLAEVTSQKQQGSGLLEAHGSASAKCLPKSVLDFCPTLRSHAVPVSSKQLQDNCQQWIHTCMNDVTTGVGKILSFVNTVKRLTDIRNAVWELLKEDSSMLSWDVVCTRVLNKTLSLWIGFLQPLFLNRTKALIKYQLDTTAEMTKRQITMVVMEIGSSNDRSSLADTDLAHYIWCESPGDIPPNMAWTTATTRSNSDNPGGVIMKAKAYTPVIQSLCKNFDEKLQAMLEDSVTYLQPPKDNEESQEEGPFDRYADSKNICSHIQTTCTACVQELLKYATEQLSLWEKSLQEISDKSINQLTQHKVLLVGRMCTALCEMAPSLQRCILGNLENHHQTSIQKKQSHAKTADQTPWTQIRQMLMRSQTESYRIWVDYLSLSVLGEVRSIVCARDNCDVIANSTKWDEEDIQEETEDGSKVHSKIRVPMQASWYVQSLLYKLCSEINRVGGHAINRSTLQKLVMKVSDGVMECYEAVIKDSKKKGSSNVPLSQQRALQLLFDVKFILHIIPRKEDITPNKLYQQRSQRITEALEEKIDPFDLDVFTPYIQSHLLKQGQRSSVLYGALTSLDRLGMYSAGRPLQSGQTEQHNVLPLSTCQSRFNLLPVSSKPTRSTLPTPVIKHSLYKMPDTGSSSLTEKAAAVLPTSMSQKDVTSSFYNKLGSMSELSSWFSNIGSK